MAKRTDLEKRVMIGRKLALARERTGLRQDEVAIELFGVAQKNRISEMENGKTLPDAELLQVMCSLYHCSVDWVLGFTINPELNETESVAGILFNGLGDLLAENLNAVTSQMALLCAKHIASFPPALQVRLLEQSKAVAKKFMNLDRDQQEKLQPEMIELMQTIKECDKDRAIQFTNLAKGLEDITDRDEDDIQEKLIQDLKSQRKTRFTQTTLLTEDKIEAQRDFFSGDALGT
ncbi:helix-turn-helix family protein [Acinetobacter baumannii 146457]|uniref:helix-turn-helix domain-containing protein n=1 Tax=Acinetobacter sp. NRRL B-65365 TaxID=1785092 RepID=UPI0004467851|nr:helix-turn-helix transcriptional regulator [Acinetobacter sp. NRRL B-65365]EXB47273.1 helix-turn-helix family protein [Acinetobacter baumannii 146457]KYQ82521.1 DNA-binding protein [Acinetobacter sp. NRRL B-65365]